MKLSILVPVYNEEKYIEQVLHQIYATALPYLYEVIVINDGSTDQTSNILQKIKGKYNIKILEHDMNLGKGSAIKTGLATATGDLLLIQDADLEYNPSETPKLLEKMTDSVWAVYGNRGTKSWPERGYHYVIGAKILTITINLLFHGNLKDTYTGYKLFNLKKLDINILRNLRSTGFEFEAEVTCKILKSRGLIVETPILYVPRGKKDGKHINLMDALLGFITILRNR